MAKRTCNSNCLGGVFNPETVWEVWKKRGKAHPFGTNWGYDVYGNSIRYEDYGNHKSQWGWDIDHKKPISSGGSDHLNNLQPMQCYHNRVVKSDNYPWSESQHRSRFRQLKSK